MSELNIGYTIAYIGPKKVEFPPLMNKVHGPISKAELKLRMKLAEKEGNVVTIEAKEGGKPQEVEENKKEEKAVEEK